MINAETGSFDDDLGIKKKVIKEEEASDEQDSVGGSDAEDPGIVKLSVAKPRTNRASVPLVQLSRTLGPQKLRGDHTVKKGGVEVAW